MVALKMHLHATNAICMLFNLMVELKYEVLVVYININFMFRKRFRSTRGTHITHDTVTILRYFLFAR